MMVEYSWFESPGDGVLYGCDMQNLTMDQAYLIPRCMDITEFTLNQKHKECEGCPFRELITFNCSNLQNCFILKNVPQYLYEISTKNYNITPVQDSIGEFGIFKLDVSNDSSWFETIKEPVSIYFPMLTVFLIYFLIFCCILFGNYVWKHLIPSTTDLTVNEPKKQRIKSLDIFRGISIVIMIFANYGCGGYEFIEHSIWNGLHIADLVFPWFMWIMGACIPLSLASSFKKNTPNSIIVQNVVKRSIKLFCLGIFLQSGTILKTLRIFGVLQRFGISYLVVTLICLFFMNRNLTLDGEARIKCIFGDILKISRCWLIILSILIGYCLIIFMVHDKNCPRGYFGPGGWHKNGAYFNCTGGATGYLDRLILGQNMYHHLGIIKIYDGQSFDPEGPISCLTSIVHVFIGVQAGLTLMVYKKHTERLIRWLSWGIVLGLIGGFLCGFTKNDGLIPVNKNLWSISFSFVTSCFAFTLLSFCYIFVDLKGWWSGKPFLYPGMNAILMYIGHEIITSQFPVRWTPDENGPRTHFIAFFENIWATAFWIFISYYLYKIKYFFVI